METQLIGQMSRAPISAFLLLAKIIRSFRSQSLQPFQPLVLAGTLADCAHLEWFAQTYQVTWAAGPDEHHISLTLTQPTTPLTPHLCTEILLKLGSLAMQDNQ
jgi:hypothetical protein